MKEPSELKLIVLSYLPMTTLFIIIGFIYSVYTSTFLIDIITNQYSYQAQDQTSAKPTVLIMIHTLANYSDSLAQRMSSFSELGAATTTQSKGIVFGVILHALLALFFISTYRVMKTSPGGVPDDWNDEAEKELSEAVETEKRVLHNIRRQVRKRKREEEEERKLLEEQQKTTYNQLVESSEAESLTSLQVKNTERQAEESSEGGNLSSEVDPSGQGQGGSSSDNDPEDRKHRSAKPELQVKVDNGERDTQDLEPISGEKIHQLAVMSALKRSNKRFCAHCQTFKPERTHHCRQCGVCVLKMDHHCPWVGNCVGFYNYKFFINMVFYGGLMLLFVAVTYAEVVKDVILDPTISSFLLYVILLCYVLTLLLAIIIPAFFCFHLWLVCKGKTTLEFCEKKRNTKYDFGTYGNLKRVLGRNPFLWMLPLEPHLEGQGVVFA